MIEKIMANPEFQKLWNIGGGKQYHQEGNALIHSVMVYMVAVRQFPDDSVMQLVALLHDIGKIRTGRVKSNGDWEYPNHAAEGAEMLIQFVAPWHERFSELKWYIRNHIKPLFWRQKGYNITQGIATLTDQDTISRKMVRNLIKLTICDLLGSIPENQEEQDANVIYLFNLVEQLSDGV